METEIKVGDKVYLRNTQDKKQNTIVYKVVSVDVARSGRQPVNASQTSDNNLYGRETEKLSMPQASYQIEPENGGKKITAVQGEIDLVTSTTNHSTQ